LGCFAMTPLAFAWQHLLDGRHTRAVAVCDRIISAQPDTLSALTCRAMARWSAAVRLRRPRLAPRLSGNRRTGPRGAYGQPWQVRQPISGKSVGRWKAYEKWLSPMIDAMGGMDWIAAWGYEAA